MVILFYPAMLHLAALIDGDIRPDGALLSDEEQIQKNNQINKWFFLA